MPKEKMGIVGTFTIRTWNEDGTMAEERIAKNIMCAVGLTVLAQCINWVGVSDQNPTMGNPFIAQDLTPLYGAIGTSATAPTDSDTQLTAEVAAPNGRAIVYAGATGAAIGGGTDATWTWSFFYGIPSGSITVAEAGVFVNAPTVNGVGVINTGTLLDHCLISPTVTQSTAQTLTMSVTFSIGTV